MVSLATSALKGRQPVAAISARLFWERPLGSLLPLPGSVSFVRWHTFIGRNLTITNGLDSRYVPAGGSS
jgi:hypothetical protein